MNIENNHVVGIHFNLSNSEGQKIDSSEGQGPLVYLHGAQNLIPGLENELTGKAVGDKLKVTVLPDQAYGEVNPELLERVPKDAFASLEQGVEVGMQLQAQGPDGQVKHITIQEVTEKDVLVDGNHPLAGQTLTFDVEIDSIRDASEEEIDHRHVHTSGHEHH